MFIIFDDNRLSDSPFIERVWRCHSERAGMFVSVATSHWDLVVTRLEGRLTVTLKGPETRAREVFCPANGEWLAIRFKAGTFMPQLPVSSLLDGRDLNLPSEQRTFRLDGGAWEYPTYDNAETFVARLARMRLIARDAAVVGALDGDEHALSKRSAQRHFVHATGMSYAALRQIERARHAANLLRSGVAIGDTVAEAGYFDQAHLSRSLGRLIGLSPGKIAREERQLSFLYKTQPPRRV
jgi:AraC-like DNA-binding protein